MTDKITSGEKSVQAFMLWQASMNDDDFRQIVFRGKLKRDEVAKGCGIAKSALRQNPKVSDLLERLESDLRERGVFPAEIDSGHSGISKKYDQEASKQNQNASRLQSLELRVIELEAENKELRTNISRFSELSTVLADLGRLPE